MNQEIPQTTIPNPDAISTEILRIKARLFEINEIKKSEEPLRDRLNQLIGSVQTLEEIKKQTQEVKTP